MLLLRWCLAFSGDGLAGGVPKQVHLPLEPLGLQASRDLWGKREGQDCYGSRIHCCQQVCRGVTHKHHFFQKHSLLGSNTLFKKPA